jgi:hypothetical protein
MAKTQTPYAEKKLAAVPEETPPPVLSPAAQKLSDEAGIWHEVFNILGNATIRASQCGMAKVVLDRVQVEVTRAEADLQKQLTDEAKAPEAKPAEATVQ